MDLDAIKQWLGTGSINIFGPQLSGKDTQARLLADAMGGVVIGGGDIIRGSVFPPEVVAMMDRGELLPTELYVDTVRPFLEKTEFAEKPLVLSAVGRWIGEEQGVIAVCNATNHPIKVVIKLDVSIETAITRWESLPSDDARGVRADDNEEGVRRRLELYQEKTLPVLDVYQSMGLLIEINGEQSPENVYNDIIAALNSLLNNQAQ